MPNWGIARIDREPMIRGNAIALPIVKVICSNIFFFPVPLHMDGANLIGYREF